MEGVVYVINKLGAALAAAEQAVAERDQLIQQQAAYIAELEAAAAPEPTA